MVERNEKGHFVKDKKDVVSETESLIAQYRELEDRIEQLENANKKLDTEKKELQKQIEKFDPYRELIDEVIPEVWAVELRNKDAIGRLRNLDAQMNRELVPKKPQSEVGASKVKRINKLVEELIIFATNDQSRKNHFIRLIRDRVESAD